MSNGYREWSAQVFDLALRLGGLTVRQQQVELARLLNRSAPISRAALKEWRTGTVPVPMEIVKAACDVSGYGMAKIIELVPDLEEHEAPQLQRGAQAGRIYLQLVPGGLGLIVAIIALLWVAVSGWEPAISAVENMAHRVISSPPPFVPTEIQPGATADRPESSERKSAAVVSPGGGFRGSREPNPGPVADSVQVTDPAPGAGTTPAGSPGQSSSCVAGTSTAPSTSSAPAISSTAATGSAPAASAPGAGSVPAANSASGTVSPLPSSCAPGNSLSAGVATTPITTSTPTTTSASSSTGLAPATGPAAAPVINVAPVPGSAPAASSPPETANAEQPPEQVSESSDSPDISPLPSTSGAEPGKPGKQDSSDRHCSPSGSSDQGKGDSVINERQQSGEHHASGKQQKPATAATKTHVVQAESTSRSRGDETAGGRL